MTDEQIRSVKITEVDKEEGTFRGVFAPYDEVVTYDGKQERYERGLFEGADLVDLYYNHGRVERGGDMPIGEVIEYAESETGAEIVGRFYTDTARGSEAYALTKSGKLNALSAGFVPVQVRQDADVTVWEKAHLNEVSLVKRPAYPSAKISQVRSANSDNLTKESVEETTQINSMSNENNYDDSEIRSELDSVKRELAVVRENGPKEAVASQYRSVGHIVNAAANGDNAAIEEIRAYTTGGGLADSQVRPGWYDQGLKYVNANRIGYNLFRHVPLQAEGMSFVVPTFATSTIQVGKQAEEGATLAYGKLSTAPITVNVDTYGGYIEWSRQVKDRSSIDYVNAGIDLLQIDYARKTNAAVVSAVLGASGVNTGTGLTLSSSTVAGWTGFVDEGVAAIGDTTGLLPDFMWVSRDVFYKIKGFADTTGRPLMEVNNDGTNTIGTANAVAVSGRFQGVNLVVDPALPAKTAVMGNSSAAVVFESPGAPWNLTDEDITRLTQQFSLYGYLAVGVLNPKALFKVAVA